LTKNVYIGTFGSGGPFSGFDDSYLEVLANSKIIVTANPAPWEGEFRLSDPTVVCEFFLEMYWGVESYINVGATTGDFRLWEALLSGALVFVDEMAILHWMPHSFKHKKHLIVYDPTNQTEFDNLLEYYVMNEAEAEAIGRSGYEHTLAHHMTTDRVSYILDNIESKLKLQPIWRGRNLGTGARIGCTWSTELHTKKYQKAKGRL